MRLALKGFAGPVKLSRMILGVKVICWASSGGSTDAGGISGG